MRKLFVLVWFMIPVAAAAYHFGPGQEAMVLDQVDQLIAEAESHAAQAEQLSATSGNDAARDHWSRAERAYSLALQELPGNALPTQRRLRLERAKVQMFLSQLPSAHDDLVSLSDELAADSTADSKLISDTRDALANSQYYMTWLMRLEGASREIWEPKAEAARQNYKWLVEESQQNLDAESVASHQQNLEATIRLARMDLQELQGLPIPNQ